jgi:hypothetical protein
MENIKAETVISASLTSKMKKKTSFIEETEMIFTN